MAEGVNEVARLLEFKDASLRVLAPGEFADNGEVLGSLRGVAFEERRALLLLPVELGQVGGRLLGCFPCLGVGRVAGGRVRA